MDIDAALKLCLKTADQAELFIQDCNSTSVFVDSNVVDQAHAVKETGYSIRVLKNSRVGFAIAPGSLEKTTLEDALKRALASASQNKANPGFSFPDPSPTRGKDAYDAGLDALTNEPEGLAKLASKANKELQSHGEWVPISQFKATTLSFTIANTNGVLAESRGTTLDAELYAIAKSKTSTARSEVIAPYKWRTLDDHAVMHFAEKTAKQALELLDAKPLPTQETNVIFAPGEFAALLAQTVGEALDGASVYDGTSPYKDKVGLRVAPEEFTLTDHVDAATLTPSEVGSATYASDFEGTHRAPKTFIKNGVLQGFAYDEYHAALAGVTPTSNARRSAQDLENVYKTGVGSGLGHFEIDISNKNHAGARPLKQLVEDVRDGLLVTRTGWPLADEVSGRFSCEVRNGYKIENGEFTHPVKSTLVAGSVFELLEKQALGFSKEREVHACSSASLDSSALLPFAAFSQVRVAGS